MPAATLMLSFLTALFVIFIPPIIGDYLRLARSMIANAFFVANF
jgi:hypothetical protein